MAQPKIFISHKHVGCDKEIARIVAEFCENKCNGRVSVHLSSSPDFEGPKIGKGLNDQLRKTLWNTDVLILIYTTPDQDWSYCMWECGVAMDSQSPETNIIVLQCGEAVPSPFNADLRVSAKNKDDIKKFVTELLKTPDFFPGLAEAIFPTAKESYISDSADELFNKLAGVLPSVDEGSSNSWSTWPAILIEMPKRLVDNFTGKNIQNLGDWKSFISAHGTIDMVDSRVAQMFGKISLPTHVKFEELSKISGVNGWYDSICHQIMMGSHRDFPIIKSESIKSKSDSELYTPILTFIKQMPYKDIVQYSVGFYNLSDPRAISVVSRMMLKDNFYYRNMSDLNNGEIKLIDLIMDLGSRKMNRLPIFDKNDKPLYVIHKSMVDQFLVKKMLEGNNNPTGLNLNDLFADKDLVKMFKEAFSVVNRNATISDAIKEMKLRKGVSDVFVTENGSADEPVIGWLTNVDAVDV